MSIMSLIRKWPSKIDRPKWAGISCHRRKWMEGIRTQRKAMYLHSAQLVHALLFGHMLIFYLFFERLLSGFNSHDFKRLYKIRFINHGIKTREKDRQQIKLRQILYWRPLERWNYIIYPSDKLLQNLIWIIVH